MMDGGCFVAPTPPPLRVLIPLHQKAPSRKGGGSFLTKYSKTEREGYSLFVRDCDADPPEAYAPTTPPLRVLIPLHQKAPSRKGGGSFLTKYSKTEREGYSHFVRDCEAYPPEAYAPTTPPPRVLIPLHQKAPSRKGGGSFLTKYFKTEREGFEPSHRLRSLTP